MILPIVRLLTLAEWIYFFENFFFSTLVFLRNQMPVILTFLNTRVPETLILGVGRTPNQTDSDVSSVASPKIWGAKVFDFRRITLYCFRYCLSKHKKTICSKTLWGPWSPRPPWLRLWVTWLSSVRRIYVRSYDQKKITKIRLKDNCGRFYDFLS